LEILSPIRLEGAAPVEDLDARRATNRILRIVVGIPATVAALAGAVFNSMGWDKVTADVTTLTVIFVCFGLLIAAPWWPIRGLRERSRFQKLESTSLIWVIITCIPHVTWEMGWMLFHKQIIAAKGEGWAQPWWTYIEGGDERYITVDPMLWSIESLASTMGIVGLLSFWRWYRSERTSAGALYGILFLMAFDFLACYLYYASEIFAGFPNVVTTTDLWVKFVVTNSYWLVMPWVVGSWAIRRIKMLHVTQALAARA
jgi:hypothetical protein